MKKLLLGAGVMAAVAAYAVSAYAVEQQINLNGTVAGYCTINGSSTNPGALNPSFPTVTDGNVPGGLTMSIPIGNVVCNSKAAVTLASAKGSALGPPNSNASFQNYVKYTASVASPVSVILSADNASGSAVPKSQSATSAGPTSGAVSVTLTSVATTLPLVSGAYSDVLTVTIVPTV